MTSYLSRALRVITGIELPDQCVAQCVVVDELDRKTLGRCPDDPSGDVAHLTEPEGHEFAVPSGWRSQNRCACDRDVRQRCRERTIAAPEADRFRGRQTFFATIARKLDACRAGDQ